MKKLAIVWQRLVEGGRTCDRCASTYEELEVAIETLRAVLQPLEIEPVLEVREINLIAFTRDTLASNRIWIAGRPMEDWIDAGVGSTACCSVCGDAECRTVKVDGAEFETVPKELFLRAALVAAASLLATPSAPTTN